MKVIKALLELVVLILTGFIFYIVIDDFIVSLDSAVNIEIEETTKFDVEIDSDLINDNDVSDLEDSGVTYDNIEFNASFYPYYDMLTDNEKALYNQLYANINEYASTFVPSMEVTTTETEHAIESLYNDHPELFWVDSSFGYKYTEDGKCVQISLSFNSTISYIEQAKTTFDNEVNTIINNANTYTTSYEKEKYVHDYLIDTITYDETATDNQSPYSALVNRRTVCAGYARTFQLIMTKLGIPTYYVTGTSKGESHAWNIILLDDGYYNVDVTWDDTNAKYAYFNKTDAEFSATHTRISLSVNLPTCNATLYGSSPATTTISTPVIEVYP